MIGTTFKLGFSGEAVSRGLGRLSSTLGRSFGRIGVGALESAGHRLTGILGSLAMAMPDAIRETSEWAGALTDMSTATGMTVKDLVILEEKFRLAGVSAKESGAVMSRFALNLQSAATEGGAAAEALRELGFDGQYGVGKTLEESFRGIAEALSSPGIKNAESIMAALFGAKLGYQQLKLFKDWNAVTAQAIHNVGRMAETMEKEAPRLDRFGDSMGRLTNIKRGATSILMDQLFRFPTGRNFDRIFDMLEPEKFRPKIEALGNLLGRHLEVVMNEGLSSSFGDVFKNLGHKIGEGIAEALKNSLKGSINARDFFTFGSSKKETASNSQTDLGRKLDRSNQLLSRIAQQDTVATFA